MNAYIKLTIYSTAHCHLCEEALALALQCIDQEHIEVVDITNNETLTLLYETKIPILMRQDNGSLLNWPFDKQAIDQFLWAKK